MNLLGITLYVVANFVVALMVGCMLFSAFIHSSHRFRAALGLVACCSLACGFWGIELLVDVWAHKLEFGELALVAWCEVLQSIALAFVMVAMRLRQASTGAHLHPRQRAQARRAPAGADEIRLAP